MDGGESQNGEGEKEKKGKRAVEFRWCSGGRRGTAKQPQKRGKGKIGDSAGMLI